MANKKITQLPVATDVTSSIIEIVQGGTNKQANISLFGLFQTLAQTLAIDNKTNDITIESNSGDSILKVITSEASLQRGNNGFKTFDTGLIPVGFQGFVSKISVNCINHDSLNELNAINNAINGALSVTSIEGNTLNVQEAYIEYVVNLGGNNNGAFADENTSQLYFHNSTIDGYFEANVNKNDISHTVLNEFNSPENNFNGRVNVISDVDNNAFNLIGLDTNLKVVIYNSSDNAGLISVRNDVSSETIGLNGFTGEATAIKHITVGGTSSQFVKGDGSLDSSTFLDTSKLVEETFTISGTTQTLSFAPAFNFGHYIEGQRATTGQRIVSIVGNLITFDQDYTGLSLTSVYLKS